jgi:peptidoglycan hydrolase CwlO-like protein
MQRSLREIGPGGTSVGRPMQHRTPRVVALGLATGLLLVPAAGATPSASTLQGRLDAQSSRAHQVREGLSADRRRLAAYAARVRELEAQLAPLDDALTRDAGRLETLQQELRTTRARLVRLRAQSVRDRRVLADQLRAQYESPHVGLAEVVVDADGYSDLVSRVSQLRRIAAQNAKVTRTVRAAKRAADAEAAHLADVTARTAETVATERTRRDAVAHVRLEVVQMQTAAEAQRDRHSAKLRVLRRRGARLEKQLGAAQRAAAKAAGVPISGGVSPRGGYGFFPAAGTNYAVNDEPELARRLGRMARALHLHLIGLSGYRTPQHSVEVGGFANDPHTRGEASDTPGLEGVPEATLNAYGLTRPFPGAAEADHVQLHGAG